MQNRVLEVAPARSSQGESPDGTRGSSGEATEIRRGESAAGRTWFAGSIPRHAPAPGQGQGGGSSVASPTGASDRLVPGP
jgi:hypothetical protein